MDPDIERDLLWIGGLVIVLFVVLGIAMLGFLAYLVR